MKSTKYYQGQYSFDELLPALLKQEAFCRYLKENEISDLSDMAILEDVFDESLTNEYVRIVATFPDFEPGYDEWIFGVVGSWGVYRIWEQECDDIGYFTSLEDAMSAIRCICSEPGCEFSIEVEKVLPETAMEPVE